MLFAICDFRFPIFSLLLLLFAVFFDFTIIEHISFASFNKKVNNYFLTNLLSIITSNQNIVSSISSSTMPNLEINSTFERTLQAAL